MRRPRQRRRTRATGAAINEPTPDAVIRKPYPEASLCRGRRGERRDDDREVHAEDATRPITTTPRSTSGVRRTYAEPFAELLIDRPGRTAVVAIRAGRSAARHPHRRERDEHGHEAGGVDREGHAEPNARSSGRPRPGR